MRRLRNLCLTSGSFPSVAGASAVTATRESPPGLRSRIRGRIPEPYPCTAALVWVIGALPQAFTDVTNQRRR